MRKYSQLKAMSAITKGSLRAITRSPSAMIFGFVFPFIFILVFGFIGGNGTGPSLKIVIDKKTDTANKIYEVLTAMSNIRILHYDNDSALNTDLNKGRIAGVVTILKSEPNSLSPYEIKLNSTTSSNDKWPQLRNELEMLINKVSDVVYKDRQKYAQFNFNPEKDIAQVREYKTIDFILPGQLGFSLLSAGVFGVAFMFYNLRNTLVLKRFFATPINKTFIILGEGLSRVLFQMLTAIVIILVGYFVFDFTLIHGFRTFFDMMLLSFIGLLVFMGFGFIISGVAKTDSTIPPFANLITLPQFLLGGTFFPVDDFPKWLQPISKAMPLTHLNEAMRKIAFEGLSLWDVKFQIFILLCWGIVVYFLAIKVFKWE